MTSKPKRSTGATAEASAMNEAAPLMLAALEAWVADPGHGWDSKVLAQAKAAIAAAKTDKNERR